MAMVSLAAPPNALASDALFIDDQNATYNLVGAGDLEGQGFFAWPEKGDIGVMAPQTATIPIMDDTGIVEERGIITASNMIGGDATASWGKRSL